MDGTMPRTRDLIAGKGPPPEVWREGLRVVVALRGEQDLATAAVVAEALEGASRVGEGDVVVDLSGVLFMDAAIVAELVDAGDALRLQHRGLTLRSPSRLARRLLRVCGLMELVDPVSAVDAGGIGSCVIVRGAWSRTPRRRSQTVGTNRSMFTETPAS